jgi:LysM repeat protein
MRCRLLLPVILLTTLSGRASADPVPVGRGAEPEARARLVTLLFSRARGARLEPPGSPRYLALRDPSAAGTRLLVGWMLPELSTEEMGAARTLADELTDALGRSAVGSSPSFAASASLVVTDDAPVLEVEISSPRSGLARDLELRLLGVLGSLGQSGTSTGDLLRLLHPVRRAVVETYRPGTNTVVRVNKPVRHVIERGDTLSEIAQAHGLDLQTLTRLNGIDPKRPIHPGVELKLSAQGSRRPKLYVVKAGDNLAKVARRFGVSQKALMDLNRLDDRRLSKGQKLVLPR